MTYTFDDLLYRYADYRKISGLKESANTRLRYFRNACLRRFKNETHLTQEMVDWWCLQREKECGVTHRTRVLEIMPFLRYVISTGKCSTGIIIPQPQPYIESNSIPHYFTEAELSMFFKACDEIRHHKTLQQQLRKAEVPVVFRMLYSTGIRCVEARTLDRKHVDFNKGIVHIVNSKGYRERIIVLHDSMFSLLCDYDSCIERIMPNRKVLFPDIHDNYHTDKWLDCQFREMWYKYNCEKAFPRELRHRYAIENINSWNGSEYEITEKAVALKNSMGHSKISRTLGYYALVPVYRDIIERHCRQTFDDVIPVMPQHINNGNHENK